MCTVSMVGDHFRDTFPTRHPKWVQTPSVWPPMPGLGISREEFEQVKRELIDLKELLNKAQKYDEANGEPHCEMEDKVKFIKELAKIVGVDMQDIFPAAQGT